MTADRIGVVIVTWNAADLIGACLEAIPASVDVVIVDNASIDRTIERATSERPNVRVLERSTNDGFAAAANAGLDAFSDRRATMLLNPDCVVLPDTIDRLVSLLDRHPRAGLISASVYGQDGAPERYAGGRDPSLRSVAVHYLGLSRLLPRWSLYGTPAGAVDEQWDWVAGTAVLARNEAIAEVGALDASYFLYAEDHDWCRRMRDAGWEVWVAAGARAEHRGAASVAVAEPWIREHRITSLDRYYARTHSGASLLLFRVIRVVGYAARAVLLGAAGRMTGRAAWRARGRGHLDDAHIAARLIGSGR